MCVIEQPLDHSRRFRSNSWTVRALLEISCLRENQYIEIYNVTNSERFATYIIKARRGSGTISINGAAARKAMVGDKLIVAAYSQYTEAEVETQTGCAHSTATACGCAANVCRSASCWRDSPPDHSGKHRARITIYSLAGSANC